MEGKPPPPQSHSATICPVLAYLPWSHSLPRNEEIGVDILDKPGKVVAMQPFPQLFAFRHIAIITLKHRPASKSNTPDRKTIADWNQLGNHLKWWHLPFSGYSQIPPPPPPHTARRPCTCIRSCDCPFGGDTPYNLSCPPSSLTAPHPHTSITSGHCPFGRDIQVAHTDPHPPPPFLPSPFTAPLLPLHPPPPTHILHPPCCCWLSGQQTHSTVSSSRKTTFVRTMKRIRVDIIKRNIHISGCTIYHAGTENKRRTRQPHKSDRDCQAMGQM